MAFSHSCATAVLQCMPTSALCACCWGAFAAGVHALWQRCRLGSAALLILLVVPLTHAYLA